MSLKQKMTPAEKKLHLIELILKIDFGNWDRDKSKNSRYEKLLSLLKIDLNEEIEKKVAEKEVAKMQDFALLNSPEHFLIHDIGNVFNANIYTSDYLHIYFVYSAAGVSLLFRFNGHPVNDSQNITFSAEDTIYMLEGEYLKEILPQDAKTCIEAFARLYNSGNFDQNKFSYTQYITFNSGNIKKHYSSFPVVTKFLAAAKNDPVDGKLRQNIILEIPTLHVINAETSLSEAYFNIGNMQP